MINHRPHVLANYLRTYIKHKKQTRAVLEKYREQIDELVNAGKQLEKYKILAENAKDIMLFINMDGRIIEANEAALRAYRYTREELFSMTISDLRIQSTNKQIAMQMELAEKQGILFETIHRCKDGGILPVEVSSQGTYIGDERVLLSIIRDISERKRAEQQMKYMETHDFLTGFPNRYYLEEYLKSAVVYSTAEGNGALLFLDVDNFKVINDSFGYAIGDKLLVELGNKLKNIIKKDDFIARLGGDEFAIVLKDVTIDMAKRAAQKIIKYLGSENFAIDGPGNYCNLSVSIGITRIDDFADTQKLFAYAEAALYNAKEEGKSRAVAIESGKEKRWLSESNAAVKLLHDCLRNNRLVLHYQPIMSGQQVVHYEALLRMLDNEGNFIYPSSFITMAERFGLMARIDRWVIHCAIHTLAEKPDMTIFVNVSSLSIGDDELLNFIEMCLGETGIRPERIGFEITETAAVKDLIKAGQWLRSLKKFGCKFALDDFGVGFSSFKYIQMLPVDYIKIDGSFIKNLDTDLTQKALVQAMNAVAHTLGKRTIAEFVENEMIWRTVQELGVDLGQGYYLGKPSPLAKIQTTI
ncbi:putative bifunctional diguanylate cyclase/phosphodiesterase [Sporomusa aerivorans]|uniref:putative bifunctional diguanylate cyclase/phosphodiesterase n=1 Tax=Sporomusa aerivorans TaxID=204936 RepID=UPI00352A6F3F